MLKAQMHCTPFMSNHATKNCRNRFTACVATIKRHHLMQKACNAAHCAIWHSKTCSLQAMMWSQTTNKLQSIGQLVMHELAQRAHQT